jgi:uridine kinase
MQTTIHATIEAIHGGSKEVMDSVDSTIATRAHYSPPWADVSIIGIAGSSGSGKSTLSQAIVRRLNLPWVVIMSIVSFVPGQSRHEIALTHLYG